MWFFTEEPWQYRILDQMPSGVDEAQIDRFLTLTPTQRLEAVMELMAVAEELQDGMSKTKVR